MSRSMILGILIVIVIGLIPMFLLFQYGPHTNLSTYPELTHKLGEMAALIGVTLFALSFVLSTRLKPIEEAFGGLDKVYVMHGIIGSSALVLLLFHPILLVLRYIPANLSQAAIYLSPGTYWSVNFGIIALVGLAVLVGITLYSRMKYHHWKFTHEFMGALFAIAMLHIFLVRDQAARDYIFDGYYIFTTIIAAIGLIAFLYSLLMRNRAARHGMYTVKSINTHGDVFELAFEPKDEPLKYTSGQFVFLRFSNKKVTAEPHPFSIASRSGSNELKVYIKNLGDFTQGLVNLNVGDKVSIEGPYGKFSYTDTDKDQVWIAGGIGITPFIGMVQDLDIEMKNKVTLYYAVNSHKELLAQDIFKTVQQANNNFKIIPWIKTERGYLNAKGIKETSGPLKNKEFYICGPPGMKKALADELLLQGVKNNMIIMEDFNLR